MRFRYLAIGAAALLVGCGSNLAESGQSTAPAFEPEPSADLVPALYPECGELGEQVHAYLTTGDAAGQPDIEQELADDRAAILSNPADAQAGLMRAAASDVIERCDQQRADEDAAQVAAEQEAQEEQARLDEEAALDRAYAAGCAEHGGYVDGGLCVVDYPGAPQQWVTILDDGTFDQGEADLNREDCASELESAQLDADDGFPWQEVPVFHEDTGVCVYGTP